MAATVHGFQTEVTKLLNLLAHSLYSNKEIFLRELISNASDAIDKLHFLSLTNADLIKDDPEFKIRVRADKQNNTLTIIDNGIGLTLEEANSHLGTIAKSGTEEFVKNLSGDQAKDSQLIGQFGVGFYSSFIVADRVTVISRSVNASADEGVRWTSDGSGTFESENINVPNRGTQVILHLKEGELEFLNNWTLRSSITKYSDHISTPVEIYEEVEEIEEESTPEATAEATDTSNNVDNAETAENAENTEEKKPKTTFKYVQVNDAKALWTRNAKEISDEEYQSFFKHAFNEYSDPIAWAHNKVEGELEYTSLLYIPGMAPFNLMMRDSLNGLKLYIQRVFIMDDSEQFLPPYLRFVRGLLDTNALPLNVSREILQDSKATRKLKSALTKRALGLIEKISTDKEKYAKFVTNYNDVLKEGLSDDFKNYESILKLIRFASTYDTNSNCTVSIDDYISRMKDKQQNIYYLCADSYELAVNSPYLERLKSKGIEVLLLWKQPIDSWISSNLRDYQGKKFISATAADLELGELEDSADKEKLEQLQKEHEDLVARFKEALGLMVDGVRVSTSLGKLASCVVLAQGMQIPPNLRLLAKMQGQELPEQKYTLEINPEHPLVQKAYQEANETIFKDWAKFIYLQSVLNDEGGLKNPSEFIALTQRLMLGASTGVVSEESCQEESCCKGSSCECESKESSIEA